MADLGAPAPVQHLPEPQEQPPSIIVYQRPQKWDFPCEIRVSPPLCQEHWKLTAASTGQTRNAAELGREVGLGREQAMTYLRLLELVYVAFELPAWSVNLSSRVTKRLASRTPNLLLEV
jgi:hypothetical protein